MPSVSQKQQEFFGAALARKRAGKSLPSDPKMDAAGMKEFASTPRKGLPYRSASSKKKRRLRVAAIRAK